MSTTTTKNILPNSYSASATKTEATCNICKRLLYAFEEVLRCRVCYGAYHWRCVKPQRASRYGQNDNYICENCNDGTAANSSYRSNNGTNRGEFFHRTVRTNSTETSADNTNRHYEDKHQVSPLQKTSEMTELDDYDHQNSQSNDDSRRTQPIEQQQQQPNGIESDDENDTSAMFQANYQYTPLKDFAAIGNNNHRTTNDQHSNSYQNSSSDNSSRLPTARYGGGLHYTNHGYDPTVTRLVEPPSMSSTNPTSPTADNLSIHHRPDHFISTTSLNLSEKHPPPNRRQQQPSPQARSFVHSTSYSPLNRENDSSVFKPSFPQQTDRRSTVGSDSGIVTVISTPQEHADENHIVEKKVTNLVQQLGKQLENDSQKLNEKLEVKLKDLENMIHQQTLVIRRQDEVIERLKDQILQTETERDQLRHQLSAHEKVEENEKRQTTAADETQTFERQDFVHEQEDRSDRKHPSTPTVITDNSQPLTKKASAPRINNQWPTTNDEHEPRIARLVKNTPSNRKRVESDSSSASSISDQVTLSDPIVERPAASSRLDNIIHQINTKDVINPPSTSYSLAQVRHQDRSHTHERVSVEQQIITSVHHDDSDDDSQQKENVLQQKQSHSSSSLSSAESLPARTVQTDNTLSINRNPNKYPSFESLKPSHLNEQNRKLSTKTASLQFGTKSVRNDETATNYIPSMESNHPAIQSNGTLKGWLRKQNRDSFFKRIERYYCVLRHNTLLMYRHDYDRTAHKTLNMKGGKVLYYDDPKFGPSLELTWSNPSNEQKHYHLYAPNPQEAEQWVLAIQTAMNNLENKVHWQRYRMIT